MKVIKTIISIACILLTFTSCQQENNPLTKGDISIIPKPVHLQILEGSFTFNEKTNIIYTDSVLNFPAHYLQSTLEKYTGYKLNLQFSSRPETWDEAIVLSLDNKIDHPEEYHLTIASNISIRGKDSGGVFYGVQSFSQIVFANKPKVKDEFNLPHLKIKDFPRFSWRGMHLDVSRHFFDTQFIKNYIDILALHKLNTFHWHLVDDQGWRIEIKKYPRLTQVGAWRVDREHLPWNERPAQKPGETATYGGFYTQEEIKEIVAYAQQRNITVVPEIELPAHVSSALAAYPEYSCKGTPITVPPGGVWPITDIYCAGKEETFTFLEDILVEVMELFPSKFIHIGGDEANKSEWENCEKCQARIKSEGLKNEHELQSYFIQRIDRFLTDKDRRLIGWDEILEGGLAENAAVMSWRGEQGGIQAATMNHDVVMTPVSHCYFDYYQSLDKDLEPLAFGGFTDLEKVYHYQVIPNELDSISARHVLGAQGNLWTEYITSGDHVEYMALPRMTALSEVLWSPERNFRGFKSRLHNFLDILSFRGINYHVPAPGKGISEMIFIDSLTIALENPWPFGKIYYTLDESKPTSQSTEYTQPIVVTEEGAINAAFILENGKSSEIKRILLKKKTPLASMDIKENPETGLKYRYYEGAISKIKDLDKLEPKSSGYIEKIEIPESFNGDNFGLEITGLIKIPSDGVYTFTLVSDDGSQLFIDDQLIVNSDGMHGPEPKSGQVALKEGFHAISVLYFEAGGGETLEAYLEGQELEKQIIPERLLFRKFMTNDERQDL